MKTGLDDLSKEEIAILDKYYDKLDYLRDIQKEKERHARQLK